jgi:redox-regulated HSP33 family molecular chaperone
MEIRCHHCNTAYGFAADDLAEIYAQRFGDL